MSISILKIELVNECVKLNCNKTLANILKGIFIIDILEISKINTLIRNNIVLISKLV